MYRRIPAEKCRMERDMRLQLRFSGCVPRSLVTLMVILCAAVSPLAFTQNRSSTTEIEELAEAPAAGKTVQDPPSQPEKATWKYGGFADIGYLYDFNDPSNHLFRSRGTTFRVNEVDLNMAAIYLKKPVSDSSRWGTELTLQAGKDSEAFGFSATAPSLAGS